MNCTRKNNDILVAGFPTGRCDELACRVDRILGGWLDRDSTTSL